MARTWHTWFLLLGLLPACDLRNVVATPIPAQSPAAAGNASAATGEPTAATAPTAPVVAPATSGTEIPIVRERPRGMVDAFRLESLAPKVITWNNPNSRMRELVELGQQKGCSAILFDPRQWIIEGVGEAIETGILVSVGGSNASSLQFSGLRGICLRPISP